jgi:hypothetical protein
VKVYKVNYSVQVEMEWQEGWTVNVLAEDANEAMTKAQKHAMVEHAIGEFEGETFEVHGFMPEEVTVQCLVDVL